MDASTGPLNVTRSFQVISSLTEFKCTRTVQLFWQPLCSLLLAPKPSRTFINAFQKRAVPPGLFIDLDQRGSAYYLCCVSVA